MKNALVILLIICSLVLYVVEMKYIQLKNENLKLKSSYENVKFKCYVTEMQLDKYQMAFSHIDKRYPEIAEEFDYMINVSAYQTTKTNK